MEFNDINDNTDEIDEIRKPDKIIKDKLIEKYESDDDEMNLALDVSRNQYLTDNNLYDNILINEQLKIAIDLSLEEHTNKLTKIVMDESIQLENERIKNIEISERKKSLEEFSKRIKSLSYSVSEIEIKNFIEQILDDYFNLNIEFVNIENDMYEKIYKIIDSYYLIPIQKNYKKTAISKDEDQIIRNIFRKKEI
jgi:hypothetical protein